MISWSLAPAVIIIYGINLSDRTYVHNAYTVSTMTRCLMTKNGLLAGLKREIGPHQRIHLGARCSFLVPDWTKPRP